MLAFPQFDPVAFQLGPVKVHWYGLMYLVGFVGGWWLGRVRARRPDSGWRPEQVADLLFYIALGTVLGGRIGYMLFYASLSPGENGLRIWEIWKGGMSFHGGLLGVIFAMWLYGFRRQRSFFQVADFVAPLVCVGLFAGRIGNFINGELWGKPAPDFPLAMIFPTGGPLPRHPSMLYEAFLEGIVLFIILWLFSRKPRPTMSVSALFLLCYGIFRFSVEFVREPDRHIGYLAFDWVTMGQVLSLPMILLGLVLLALAYSRQAKEEGKS